MCVMFTRSPPGGETRWPNGLSRDWIQKQSTLGSWENSIPFYHIHNIYDFLCTKNINKYIYRIERIDISTLLYRYTSYIIYRY